MNRTRAVLLACASCVCAGSTAFGGGYEVGPQSAVASGTAGAGTARVDAAAAWLNPAGLADGGGLRLGVGLSLAWSTVEASGRAADGDAWGATTDHGASVPPHVYASYADGDWAAGLSFNVPFGSKIGWPADGPLRFEAVSSAPRFFRLAPFFAWRFGALRVAAGPHVDFGSFELRKATDHIDTEGSVHLSLRGVGIGGHAALHVAVSPDVELALTYKSRTSIALDGEADFDVPTAFSARFFDQRASASWTLPDRIALGLRADAGPVDVFADVSATLWSVNDTLVIDFEDDATDDTRVVSQWRDTVALRAGVDWAAARRLVVRAGVAVDGIFGPPAPAKNLSPTSPDGTRVELAVGASWSLGWGLSLDGFYEHLRILGRASTSADAPEADYVGWAHIIGLGLRYEPGAL